MKIAKQNDLLFIVISLCILTVIWVGLNLYHAHVNSTITDTQNAQVIPISPHFDRSAIEKLKARTKVDPLLDTVVIASSSPTPTISVTPTTESDSQSVSSGAAKTR